jgi:hypothetical protein
MLLKALVGGVCWKGDVGESWASLVARDCEVGV